MLLYRLTTKWLISYHLKNSSEHLRERDSRIMSDIETKKIAIREDIIMIGPRNALNTVYYVWLHATIARTF